MSRTQTAGNKPSSVSRALARDRLGVPAVLFFVLAGVAPLTVAAGVIPTAYQTTGLTGIPAAFVVIAVILAIFSSGYVAMTRHITNAARSTPSSPAAWAVPPGWPPRWWRCCPTASCRSACTGRSGRTRPARPPPTCMCTPRGGCGRWARGRSSPCWACCGWTSPAGSSASCCARRSLVILAETVTGLAHPAGGHLSFATLSPAALTSAGLGTFGVLAVVAVLGFVGFEQAPVLAEEARNARRTIPVATYLALGMIAVVYAGASWAMAAHAGTSHVVAAAGQQGPGLLFGLGGSGVLSQAAQWLFLTSLFAAALAFHNCVLALHRTRSAGRTCCRPRSAAPAATTSPRPPPWRRASPAWPSSWCTRSTGQDPMTRLFFWLGTTGGFGILILLAVTAVAVIAFFARDPRGENAWRRLIAPALAAILLGGIVVLATAALRHPARRARRRHRRVGAARQLRRRRGHRAGLGADPQDPPPARLRRDRARRRTPSPASSPPPREEPAMIQPGAARRYRRAAAC